MKISRKVGQSIFIGDNIRVSIAAVNGPTIEVQITAPRAIDVLRGELYADQKKALGDTPKLDDMIKRLVNRGIKNIDDISERQLDVLAWQYIREQNDPHEDITWAIVTGDGHAIHRAMAAENWELVQGLIMRGAGQSLEGVIDAKITEAQTR
jgi:carbon storage regulator